MGYRSQFTLTIYKPIESDPFIKRQLEQIDSETEKQIIRAWQEENYDAVCAIDEFGYTADKVKWYDFEKDLEELSKQYPQYVFVMDRNGEDWDDVERVLAYNGKLSWGVVRIEWPDTDLMYLSLTDETVEIYDSLN